ncbi:MAG: carboxypeptidase-like regulatory domain-containing protein, partial [Acidobacteriota bacterium]
MATMMAMTTSTAGCTRRRLFRRFWLAAACALTWAATSTADVPVSGRVLDASGEAVAAGTVELRPLDADPFAPAAVSADFRGGRFTVAAPRTGPWRVTVRAPGQIPM